MPPSPLLERIKPLVHRILSSPSIIPSQVSAKTVRQALIDDHGINKDELTNSKKEVKELILSIFRELYPDEPGGQPDADNNMMLSSPAKGANGDVTMEPATPLKRKRDELIASQSIAPSSPAVPLVEETSQKKNRPKAKKEVDEDDDSEIARKLQKALNGERATRNAGKKRKAGTSSGAEGKKSRVKSKEYVISDNDDSASGSEATGKPVKKRKSKPAEKDGEPGPAKGGFQKPYILSDELAAVLGTQSLPRPQVVKQLWIYIKDNGLQKPTNKKVIVCDEKLQKVFKAPEIDMFQMNKVLGSHLRTADE